MPRSKKHNLVNIDVPGLYKVKFGRPEIHREGSKAAISFSFTVLDKGNQHKKIGFYGLNVNAPRFPRIYKDLAKAVGLDRKGNRYTKSVKPNQELNLYTFEGRKAIAEIIEFRHNGLVYYIPRTFHKIKKENTDV